MGCPPRDCFGKFAPKFSGAQHFEPLVDIYRELAEKRVRRSRIKHAGRKQDQGRPVSREEHVARIGTLSEINSPKDRPIQTVPSPSVASPKCVGLSKVALPREYREVAQVQRQVCDEESNDANEHGNEDWRCGGTAD